MDPAPKRPWYRLHWLTLAICVIVAGATVYRETEQHQQSSGRGRNDFGPISFMNVEFGWPLIHRNVFDETKTLPSGVAATTTLYHLDRPSLTFNLLIGFILVTASAITVESRCRNSKLWQVTLREMLIVIAIVAILLWLAIEEERLVSVIATWGGDPAFLHEPRDYNKPLLALLNPLRWPLIFALGCMIYSLGWLACSAVLRVWSLVRRVRT